MTFKIVARTQAASLKRGSLLNFEPWSRNLFETKYKKRQKDITYAII